jgi:hypothetical protein
MAMSIEQLREALRQKITSREQLCELLVNAHYENRAYWGANLNLYNLEHGLHPSWTTPSTPEGFQWPRLLRDLPNGSSARIPASQWWLAREWLRAFYGVYQLTPDMWRLAQHPMFAMHCLHVAVGGEDQFSVAYTASPEDGQRDKQVRTSLAKFLRKTCLVFTDDYIRDLDAAHRSELSDEVTFLRGDEIVEAYESGRPDSCMAKPVDHFNSKGIHPAQCYADTPELSLAVTYDGAGRINARALCYENPTDPKDKRYVRVYGDTTLRRRLERRGFKLKGLAGARLKKIIFDEHSVAAPYDDAKGALCPYIDPPGGPGGASDPTHARSMVPEGEFWRLLSAEQTAKVNRITGKSVPQLSNSSGVGVVHEASYWLDEYRGLIARCALSDREYDALAITDTVDVWHNGSIQTALADEAQAREYTTSATVLAERRLLRKVYVNTETPTFVHGGALCIDTDDVRQYYGYMKLDAELYPEQQGWQYNADFYDADRLQPDGTFGSLLDARTARILYKDAVEVIRPTSDDKCTGRKTFVHRSDFEAAKERLQKVASTTRGEDLWAAADVVVSTTPSGRRVVLGVHAVALCIDGTVDYERNLDWYDAHGLRFHYRGKRPNLLDADTGPLLKAKVRERYYPKDRTGEREDIYRAFVRTLRAFSARFFVVDTDSHAGSRPQTWDGHYLSLDEADHYAPFIEQARATAERLVAGEVRIENMSPTDWYGDNDSALQTSQVFLALYEVAVQCAADWNVSMAVPEPTADQDEQFALAAE